MIVGEGANYERIMGLAGTTSAIVGAGVSAAAPPILAAVGAGAAIPFVGPAVAGVTALVGIFTKHGRQKIAATNIVNQAAILMQQNLDAWKNSNKTPQEQVQAENNFNTLFQEAVQALKSGDLGSAGERGIQERSRGGKYDWFKYYYDPIANDPAVGYSQPGSLFSSGGNGGSVSGGTNWIVVLAGVGLIGYLLASS